MFLAVSRGELSVTIDIYEFRDSAIGNHPTTSVKSPPGMVRCVDWSSNGRMMAVGTADGYTHVWVHGDFDPPIPFKMVLWAIFQTPWPVNCLKFSPCGKWIAIGLDCGTTICDLRGHAVPGEDPLATTRCLSCRHLWQGERHFPSESAPIHCVTFNQTCVTATSISDDGKVFHLDLIPAKKPTHGVATLMPSSYPSALEVAIARGDQSRMAWDIAYPGIQLEGRPVTNTLSLDKWGGEHPTLPGGHQNLACSPDGELLASSSADSPLTLWRVGNLARPIVSFTDPPKAPAINVFSRDGELLVTGAADGTLHVHKVRDLLALDSDRVGLTCELGLVHR